MATVFKASTSELIAVFTKTHFGSNPVLVIQDLGSSSDAAVASLERDLQETGVSFRYMPDFLFVQASMPIIDSFCREYKNSLNMSVYENGKLLEEHLKKEEM